MSCADNQIGRAQSINKMGRAAKAAPHQAWREGEENGWASQISAIKFFGSKRLNSQLATRT
eukprot:1158566-Pelagomonas_calceolata.AAC.5